MEVMRRIRDLIGGIGTGCADVQDVRMRERLVQDNLDSFTERAPLGKGRSGSQSSEFVSVCVLMKLNQTRFGAQGAECLH